MSIFHGLNVDLTNISPSFLCPLFSPEMAGTGEDISQVHWKQQWLENGTLYFHVSMTESELLAQTTQPTAREPAHVLHEHMHLLHISVMVSYENLSLGNMAVDILYVQDRIRSE